jgi:glycerol uptake facilitator protein
MFKKITPYVSEFFGTFIFTFVVMLSVMAAQFPVVTPILAAVTLGLFVYTIGHLSGPHLNPAVTIAMWSIKKIAWRPAVFYIISQFAGAALTILVAYLFGIGQADPSAVQNSLKIAGGEAFGAMVFLFGVAAVVYGRVTSSMSGVVVGASLLIGVTFGAILGVGGILNPAIAFAIGAFNVAYVLGPIVGAVIGAQVYRLISER